MSLEGSSKELTWPQLQLHTKEILDKFSDPDIVADLHWQHNCAEKSKPSSASSPSDLLKEEDMVFENAILFLRDALLSREFTDAVKCGDLGHVVLVLKTWALSFCGSGCTKYAHEMLHLIHNITSVWPQAIW